MTEHLYRRQNRVSVRRARPDDAVWALSIRNQEHVRASSKNKDLIELDTHRTWWSGAVTSADKRVFVIVHDTNRIGVVWFQRQQKTRFGSTISIYLDKSAQGDGLGRAGIILACGSIPLTWFPVNAGILMDNEPSKRCFQAAGFWEVQQ